MSRRPTSITVALTCKQEEVRHGKQELAIGYGAVPGSNYDAADFGRHCRRSGQRPWSNLDPSAKAAEVVWPRRTALLRPDNHAMDLEKETQELSAAVHGCTSQQGFNIKSLNGHDRAPRGEFEHALS
jgi:hypothetical protein